MELFCEIQLQKGWYYQVIRISELTRFQKKNNVLYSVHKKPYLHENLNDFPCSF